MPRHTTCYIGFFLITHVAAALVRQSNIYEQALRQFISTNFEYLLKEKKLKAKTINIGIAFSFFVVSLYNQCCLRCCISCWRFSISSCCFCSASSLAANPLGFLLGLFLLA